MVTLYGTLYVAVTHASGLFICAHLALGTKLHVQIQSFNLTDFSVGFFCVQ